MVSKYQSRPARTLFLPLLLLGGAFLWSMVDKVGYAAREIAVLDKKLDAQVTPLRQAKLVSDQLDAIASSTMVLAEAGNPIAMAVVRELRRQGIRLEATGSEADYFQ